MDKLAHQTQLRKELVSQKKLSKKEMGNMKGDGKYERGDKGQVRMSYLLNQSFRRSKENNK